MLPVNPFAKKNKSGKLRNITWKYLSWHSLYLSVDVGEQKYLLLSLLLSHFVKSVTLICGERLRNRVKKEGE